MSGALTVEGSLLCEPLTGCITGTLTLNNATSSNGSGAGSPPWMSDGSYGMLATDQPLGPAPQMTNEVLIRVIVLVVIGCASILANGMALSSISRMRERRMSSHSSTLYTLLAHMAIADLLVTLFCILTEAAWTYTIAWLADDLTCKFVKYMQVFSLYLSTYILVVLALDQLLIVRFPLQRETNISFIKRGVAAAWVTSAVLSLPQVS